MPIKRKFAPITMGDFGATVKHCQELLRNAGSSIKINGEFTIGMLSAVKSFQNKHKLIPNGKIDEATMKALVAYEKIPAKRSKKCARKK